MNVLRWGLELSHLAAHSDAATWPIGPAPNSWFCLTLTTFQFIAYTLPVHLALHNFVQDST